MAEITSEKESESDDKKYDTPVIKEYSDVSKISYSRNDAIKYDFEDLDKGELLKLHLNLIQTLYQGIDASNSVINAITHSGKSFDKNDRQTFAKTINNRHQLEQCVTNMRGMIDNLSRFY